MRPWIARRRPKAVAAAGERLRPAAATLALVRPLMAQAGITRLADITGLDRVGVPVVAAVRPEARAVAVSLGKGPSREEAQVGALMESLETWHAERIALPLRLASLVELEDAGETVLDPDALAKAVDAPFPRHARLLWIEADEIVGDRRVWLPFEAVHTDYTLPGPPRSNVLAMTSNGLASGNHVLEALVQALLEAVERDALAGFEALAPAEIGGRALDLAAVADPACRAVLARIEAAGLTARAFLMPGRGGVPGAAVLVDGLDADVPPSRGQACDPDPAAALRRALLEALQTRLTFIAGARDDLDRGAYGRAAVGAARARAEPLLGIEGRTALPRSPPPLPLAERADALVEAIAADGIGRIAVLELPPLTPEIAVVRAVVPGLRLDGWG